MGSAFTAPRLPWRAWQPLGRAPTVPARQAVPLGWHGLRGRAERPLGSVSRWWSSPVLGARSGSALAAPAATRARRLRVGREVFGPCPPEPVLTPEEIWAAEFARELQGDLDPKLEQHSERLRSCKDSGDWRGACGVIEDMWNGKLEPDAWMYSLAIQVCDDANETESAAALRSELESWGAPSNMRFQLSPICQWQRQLKRAGCGAHNTLDWRGKEPVPEPENGPCWLLPAQDEAAEDVAYWQKELRHAGWKLLTCKPEVIATLRSKAELHVLADHLGLSEYMPERYASPAEASYPCILKASRGTWGKGTSIVYSSDEALRTMHPSKIYEVERQAEQQLEYRTQHREQGGEERDSEEAWVERAEAVDDAVREWMEGAEYDEVGSDFVLQELAPGYYEYSTTLLVYHGQILDSACSRYEYSSDIYVWPVLEYLKSEYVSVPKEHLAIMSEMLVGFSGICNFNYKIRPCGRICIFEVNPRVGGDLVFDVPKKRVRSMLEKLDAMFS